MCCTASASCGHIIADSAPLAVVTSRDSDAAYPTGCPLWDVDALSAAAADREDAGDAGCDASGDDPALIIYTSGTTGTAKGALLVARQSRRERADAHARVADIGGDRYLAVLPLFHVHGLGNGVHCWLISGCMMRLLERFDHRTAPAELLDFRPTLFFGVPTIYVRLLDPAVVAAEQAREIGTAARLFVSGSAPLPAHVHAAFRDAIRAHDSRAVWHERGVDDHEQSL